ncbi:phage portal protein [Bifidobacterium olomucense]|uniref:Phage portal protein n=1 Tax=Bifidobacterium olomucense TaxID=2675324 RepID=A0A7Y0EZN0_9BIFI|nr:phage portal protein [Bifidobacterium sp. DSM 109959]NMM99336.1 phage portal protein [Bifidobacterium sp. DSM 109959]
MIQLVPNLQNVEVPNLPGLYRNDFQIMVRQWVSRLGRNLLRTTYYDGRNRLKNLDIAVPDSMANITEVVGWPQKAVDVLANRIRFDGFVTTGDQRDPLGLGDILDANDFPVTLTQAVRSGLTHCCSFLSVRSARPDDHIDSPVVVSFRSALYATGIWEASRRGLACALTVVDIDWDLYATQQLVVPTELFLYEPGVIIRIRRIGELSYMADAPQQTNLDHVPVYMLPYHQDLERPFGRSRISREVMSLTDTAVRTMLRMEVSAEFYSSPQRYLLGAEPPVGKDGKTLTGWEAAISNMLVINRDEDGQLPSIGQFSQMTMQPHSDMLRALAGRFSGATGVPMAQLGVMTDSGPSSADAIAAAETELVIEARNTCDAFGAQLRKAAKDMAVLNGANPDDPALRNLQVNWRNPERPSQAAMADAVLKQVQAIPWLANSDVILEMLGYTDSQITRLLSDKNKQNAAAVLDKLVNMNAQNQFANQAVTGGGDGNQQPESGPSGRGQAGEGAAIGGGAGAA